MRKRIIILTAVLLLLVSFGFTYAFYTDNESHINKLTMGKIQIDLEEPDWDETDETGGPNNTPNGIPDAAEKATGNKQINKNPVVENTGMNEAIIFLRITCPKENVTMIADNGLIVKNLNSDGSPNELYPRGTSLNTTTAHFYQDLFYFKLTSDIPGNHVNHFNIATTDKPDTNNKYWIRLPDAEYNNDTQHIYVFGYNSNVQKGEKTEPLFDIVQVKNIIENEIAINNIEKIKVEAYAIQSDNIIYMENETAKSSNLAVLTTDEQKRAFLTTVLNTYINQNGALQTTSATYGNMNWIPQADRGQTEKEADTNNEKNLKGNIL